METREDRGIKVRPAVEADLAILARFSAQNEKHHLKLHPGEHETGGETGELFHLRAALKDTRQLILLAEDSESAIGFIHGSIVQIESANSYRAYVEDLFIERSFRGRGVGRLLVSALGSWFERNNMRTVEVWVTAGNSDALRFWGHMGFQTVALRLKALTKSLTRSQGHAQIDA